MNSSEPITNDELDNEVNSPTSRISQQEFTVLVALMMSIVAISIDALLPA